MESSAAGRPAPPRPESQQLQRGPAAMCQAIGDLIKLGDRLFITALYAAISFHAYS